MTVSIEGVCEKEEDEQEPDQPVSANTQWAI